MQRHNFQHNDLTLSWLDAGGDGPLLIALYAHWMEAQTFAHLARDLAPDWRVVALDQRGHGESSHAASYTREDYLGDLEAFIAKLGVTSPVVLLGNSLGGINPVQFAARNPERVRALIIEDIGVEGSTGHQRRPGLGRDISHARILSGTCRSAVSPVPRSLLPYHGRRMASRL